MKLDAKKIYEQFNKYPHIRILFFFDPTREYENDIAKMQLNNIRIIESDGRLFRLKYRLEYDLNQEKVLLYLPMQKPDDLSEFLLLDLLVANKELQLDDVDSFIDEYNLKAMHKALVIRYKSELIQKKYENVLSTILNPVHFNKKNLLLAFASAILGFKTKQDSQKLLIKLFVLQYSEKKEKLEKRLKQIQNLEAEQILLDSIKQIFNKIEDSLSIELISELITRLKYNLITYNIEEASEQDNYAVFKEKNTNRRKSQMSLWVEWQNNKLLQKNSFTILTESGKQINEEKILNTYGLSADYWLYTPKMTAVIARSILPQIRKNPQKTLSIFRKISESGNLNTHLNHFLANSIEFYTQYNDNKGFVFDKLSDYYYNYTQKHYLFDYYYRKIVFSYQKFKREKSTSILAYDDFFTELEKDYQNFLIELNNEWLKIAKENDFNIHLPEIAQQSDFYQKEIKQITAKKVVIISDALRYEVANELKNKITAEHDIFTELNFAVSQVPSRTNFGMAALLPHKKIEFKNNIFTIEGISTSGIENRRKIIQYFHKNADAIKYSDFNNKSERELREIFKKNLVYIYHDTIDATGDARKSEHESFEAVEKAIQELSAMIKRIHSTMGVSYIFVTADHGFIYQNNSLDENMFSPIPENINTEATHIRDILHLEKISEIGISTFPLSKTSVVDSDLFVSIANGINRFRKQGIGYQFFHGGMALQEIIVPVLLSKKGQKTSEQKVGVILLNKKNKIVSNALKVLLQQINSVSNKHTSLNLICGIYNKTNQLVSNEKEVLLNFSSPLATERTTSFILHLGSTAGNESFYYLRIYDKEDTNKLNPIIDQRIENSSISEIDEFI